MQRFVGGEMQETMQETYGADGGERTQNGRRIRRRFDLFPVTPHFVDSTHQYILHLHMHHIWRCYGPRGWRVGMLDNG